MFKKNDQKANDKSKDKDDTVETEFIEAEEAIGINLDAAGKKAEMIISGGSVAERLSNAFLKDKPKLKSTVSVLIKSLSYGIANANNKGDNNMTEVVKASEHNLKDWFSILGKNDIYSTDNEKKKK